MALTKYSNIDEYHAAFAEPQRSMLDRVRAIIHAAAPEAEEVISYNMPAFRQEKVLVYYAGYAHHIGFYPTSEPIIAFADKIAKYKTSKGAIQFPLDKPLPVSLIKEIVKYRIRQVKESAAAKKSNIKKKE